MLLFIRIFVTYMTAHLAIGIVLTWMHWPGFRAEVIAEQQDPNRTMYAPWQEWIGHVVLWPFMVIFGDHQIWYKLSKTIREDRARRSKAATSNDAGSSGL